jgi:predicted DNA-binding protein
MSQQDRDAALRALQEPIDFTGAVIDREPSRAKLVHSVRLDPELSERLVAEATRRGATPSEVIRDLVEAGLTAADESATVRIADVRRVIDALANKAA